MNFRLIIVLFFMITNIVFASYYDEINYHNNNLLKDAIDNFNNKKITELLNDYKFDLTKRLYKQNTDYCLVTLFSYLVLHKNFDILKTILEKYENNSISFCENIEKEVIKIFNHDKKLFNILLNKVTHITDIGQDWLNILLKNNCDTELTINIINKFKFSITKQMLTNNAIKEHMQEAIKKEQYALVHYLTSLCLQN